MSMKKTMALLMMANPNQSLHVSTVEGFLMTIQEPKGCLGRIAIQALLGKSKLQTTQGRKRYVEIMRAHKEAFRLEGLSTRTVRSRQAQVKCDRRTETAAT
jgi:hypothetical protein